MNSEPLLQLAKSTNRQRRFLPRKYYAPVFALTILVVCGILAFALTEVFCWVFEEKCTQSVIPTTSTEFVPRKGECGKRIVGYYIGWDSKEITHSQLSKLTHVVYCCLALNLTDVAFFKDVESRREFLDIRNQARSSNTGVKVMASIGGSKYSQFFFAVCSEGEEREYTIDGIDIYWEEPNKDGTDRENYVALVRDLRLKLTNLQESQSRTFPYILTVLTPSHDWTLEDGIDLNGLAEYVDFFNVATDDYTVSWSSTLGYYTKPHAPLYPGSGAKPKYNVDWAMRYYTCETKTPQKLNMGLPFFGRYWKNVLDPIAKNDKMWRKVEVVKGEVDKGMVVWKNLQREGWNISNVEWDEKTESSYIWEPEKRWFLGIDDERNLKEKMKYVKEKNLGGVMIWTVEMDDYSDTLLSTVASVDFCDDQMEERKNEIKYKCH